MTVTPPQVDDAPGIRWIKRKIGWECRWYARTDLRERGFPVKSQCLWKGKTPSPLNIIWIKDRSRALQDEMLLWARAGEIAFDYQFDGTISGLIRCYQTDPD